MWQPIETAPKDGSEYLTYSPGLSDLCPCDIAGYNQSDDSHWKVRCGYQYVSHWAPIGEDWRTDRPPADVPFIAYDARYGTRVSEPADSWSYPPAERWQPLPEPPKPE